MGALVGNILSSCVQPCVTAIQSSPEQCKLLYCTHVRSLLSGILLFSYELRARTSCVQTSVFSMLSLQRTQECLCAIKTIRLMLSLFMWLFSTLKQRGCWLWTAAWRHSMLCYVRAQKAWAITGRLRNAEKPSLREFGRKRDEHTGLFLCNVVKTG